MTIQRDCRNDLGGMTRVVASAQTATASLIMFWSHVLDRLYNLEASQIDWLENTSSEWMTKKLIAQWKVVEQKYSDCAYNVRVDFLCSVRKKFIILDIRNNSCFGVSYVVIVLQISSHHF